MKDAIKPLALLFLTMSLIGCGSQSAPAVATPRPESISLEDWRQLPRVEKYDGATIELLRKSDKKWESERGWRIFERTELREEFRKDFPKRDQKDQMAKR